jgi:hypothetical protein
LWWWFAVAVGAGRSGPAGARTTRRRTTSSTTSSTARPRSARNTLDHADRALGLQPCVPRVQVAIDLALESVRILVPTLFAKLVGLVGEVVRGGAELPLVGGECFARARVAQRLH